MITRDTAHALRLITGPFMVIDATGEIVFVSQSLCELLKHEKSLLIGRPLAEFAGDPPEKLSKILKLFFSSGDWLVGRLSLHKGDGGTMEFPCRGCVLQRPADNQEPLIVILLDQLIQFQALGYKIDKLNTEIRLRREIEEQLRERSTRLEREIVERQFLEEELKLQAHVDYLTGACNRRHFMEKAELELSRAIRYECSLSIFMMDIDFFKQVNDKHGHLVGDIVLKKLVEICRHTLREVDIIGRLGGEEFAILLPETNRQEAAEVAERLRTAIGESKIPLEKEPPLGFTVSIGVASLTSEHDDIDFLLNWADKALYEAKETGRNKVCLAMQCP